MIKVFQKLRPLLQEKRSETILPVFYDRRFYKTRFPIIGDRHRSVCLDLNFCVGLPGRVALAACPPVVKSYVLNTLIPASILRLHAVGFVFGVVEGAHVHERRLG